jgi:hypothetical protein
MDKSTDKSTTKSPHRPANKSGRSGPRARKLAKAASLVGNVVHVNFRRDRRAARLINARQSLTPKLVSGRNRFTHASGREATDMPTPFQHFRARLEVRTTPATPQQPA